MKAGYVDWRGPVVSGDKEILQPPVAYLVDHIYKTNAWLFRKIVDVKKGSVTWKHAVVSRSLEPVKTSVNVHCRQA